MMLTIAADAKHLGARIGITAVLHTWGSAMTHHPYVHMIVPGGGILRRAALDLVAARVPGAGPGARQVAPPVVPHPAARLVRSGAALLRREHRASRRAARLAAVPVTEPEEALDGLC